MKTNRRPLDKALTPRRAEPYGYHKVDLRPRVPRSTDLNHQSLRSRAIAVALLLLASLLPSSRAAEPKPDAATKLLYSANGLFNRGLYELAAEEYQKFLKAHPNHAGADQARYALGISLHNLNKPREAAAEFERLTRKTNFKHAAEVHALLGQARLALGEHDAAAKAFRWVLDNRADSDMADDAVAGLAETALARENWQEAAKEYERLLEKWAESPLAERARFQAAIARFRLGEYEPAREHLETFLKTYRDSPLAQQAHVLIGDTWRETGKPDRAILHYDAARRMEGEFRNEALLGLAIAQFQMGQFDAGRKTAEALRKAAPESPLLRTAELYRARSYLNLDRPQDAEPILSELEQKSDSVSDDAAYWRARALMKMNQPAEAEQALRRATAAFPKSNVRAEMVFDLAAALMAQEKFADAAAAYDRVVAEFAKHALAEEAQYLAAFAFHRAGRYDESSKRATAFLAAHAKSRFADSAALVLGENFFLQKQYDQAEKQYRSVIGQYPKSPAAEKAQFRIGVVLHARKQFDQAARELAPDRKSVV